MENSSKRVIRKWKPKKKKKGFFDTLFE